MRIVMLFVFYYKNMKKYKRVLSKCLYVYTYRRHKNIGHHVHRIRGHLDSFHGDLIFTVGLFIMFPFHHLSG